ncbi:MAG TPA: hypothetical protein VI076_16190 [Actinopolymorphaceae bacterium]
MPHLGVVEIGLLLLVLAVVGLVLWFGVRMVQRFLQGFRDAP